ncbi:MAG: hypothetical protein V1747_07890 [Candidatus Omnitrophota bacterium]
MRKFKNIFIKVLIAAFLLQTPSAFALKSAQDSVCANAGTVFLAPYLTIDATSIQTSASKLYDFSQQAALQPVLETLTDNFGWPEEIAVSVSQRVAFTLSQTETSVDYRPDIAIIATATTSDQQYIRYVFPLNQENSISVVDQDMRIIRFVWNGNELSIAEIGTGDRGTVRYADQQMLLSLKDHIKDRMEELLKRDSVTLEDLQELLWMDPLTFLKDQDYEPRPLENDEIFFLMKRLNDLFFELKVDDPWVLPKINDPNALAADDPYHLLTSRRRVQIDERVVDHGILFEAMKLEADEFALFLARDAMSAHEFITHLQTLQGNSQALSGLVYQPGLRSAFQTDFDKKHKRTAYVDEESLEHTMRRITQAFQGTLQKLGKPVQRITRGEADNKEFNADEYNEFYSLFKQKIIELINSEEHVRKESELILNQIKRAIHGDFKKIRVIDLDATGKTALYVRAVIEYYAEKGELDVESAEVFIGNGRGSSVNVPKVRQGATDPQVSFVDLNWPFIAEQRDAATGMVNFRVTKSRYRFLELTYQSLRLYNEAISFFENGQKGSVSRLSKKENAKASKAKPNNILDMTKYEFLNQYQRNGFFRPGFYGSKRLAIEARLNEWFGKGNWQERYAINGNLSTKDEMLVFYEDAYVAYLRDNSPLATWLEETAIDVFDNSTSNLDSRMDYSIQETTSNHYQDIAIRRAFDRLGKSFGGSELIQVRGKDSKGAKLSPGVVPFNKPYLLFNPPLKGWWNKGSIEEFLQSSKVIVILPATFNIEIKSAVQYSREQFVIEHSI